MDIEWLHDSMFTLNYVGEIIVYSILQWMQFRNSGKFFAINSLENTVLRRCMSHQVQVMILVRGYGRHGTCIRSFPSWHHIWLTVIHQATLCEEV